MRPPRERAPPRTHGSHHGSSFTGFSLTDGLRPRPVIAERAARPQVSRADARCLALRPSGPSLGGSVPLAFSTVNRLSMALLYGRLGRLTSETDGSGRAVAVRYDPSLQELSVSSRLEGALQPETVGFGAPRASVCRCPQQYSIYKFTIQNDSRAVDKVGACVVTRIVCQNIILCHIILCHYYCMESFSIYGEFCG